jgi:hypothetical protein
MRGAPGGFDAITRQRANVTANLLLLLHHHNDLSRRLFSSSHAPGTHCPHCAVTTAVRELPARGREPAPVTA